MKIGFVIVNYNDYDTTKILLDNIKDYSNIDEIVVVDNHSTDNSYEKLKELKNDKITIILSDDNKGYASGLNIGAKYLIKKYKTCKIIFSNADIVIDSEAIISKLSLDLDNDRVGIVAPIIKEKEGVNRGWKIPTPKKDSILNIAFIHRFLRPKLLFYKDNYYKGLVEVGAVSGCFFAMNSKALDDVDYFDENTFLYYEENIIAKKLKSKNYKIMIDSDISVFHNHSVTIDKNVNRIKKFKLLKKSQLYFQKEYNKANFFDMFLLKSTNCITLGLLKIRNLFSKR